MAAGRSKRSNAGKRPRRYDDNSDADHVNRLYINKIHDVESKALNRREPT